MPTGRSLALPALTYLIVFQSLFFWMMPTGGVHSTASSDSGWFQSLFFWMMPTGSVIMIGANSWYSVSILVLLDDAYRPMAPGFRIGLKVCFNPCSSGWCLPALPLAWWSNAGRMFQSLFFWMMPTGQAKEKKKLESLNVSILVLLDDAYRPSRVAGTDFQRICFNPCSSGWCLPASTWYLLRSAAYRFQSLFFWMMPTGTILITFTSLPPIVSILVLLDDAYRQNKYPSGHIAILVFQSLFFWMMPTGTAGSRPSSWMPPGFNPCSSGWCLPARPPFLLPGVTSEFQSLFFWMMPTGTMPNTEELAEWRFNPCSSGWCLPAIESCGSRRSATWCFNPCSSGWCLPALPALKLYRP